MTMLRAVLLGAVAPWLAATALAQPAGTHPRTLYVLHCAGCHAFDGSGVPDKGVPSMRNTLGHFMHRPEGRAFLVQVPGVNNAGLSDAQIATLTNWTVTQFSAATAPVGWAAYTEAEVTEAKRHRPLDVAAARAAIVQRLRDEGHALP
jgi:mono/diheme cytochrome c family protein